MPKNQTLNRILKIYNANVFVCVSYLVNVVSLTALPRLFGRVEHPADKTVFHVFAALVGVRRNPANRQSAAPVSG